MLTIEEYISKKKRADKLDEFDYLKITENMAAVTRYVMSYFNEYLTMEACDGEEVKLKHAADKLREGTADKYPKSTEFIVRFYLQYRIRINKELEKWLESIVYFSLYYLDAEFDSLAVQFCSEYKTGCTDLMEYHSEIATLIAEIKADYTGAPSLSDMLHLDRGVVSWVQNTYRTYHVNLYDFADDIAKSYYDSYVKYEYDRRWQQSYRINCYDHRYHENPFEVDQIYESNQHRPFLANRRGELELLIMHAWVFTWGDDDEYWPEYVNLCVSRGRVSLSRNINTLIPVSVAGVAYPDDVVSNVEHIISIDGKLNRAPQGTYILRVEPEEANQGLTSLESANSLIGALHATFKQYGPPKILEIVAPMQTPLFREDTLIACCALIEKRMKRFAPMKVALVNKTGRRSDPPCCISKIEDIAKYRNLLREQKIPLCFSIDFSSILGGKRKLYSLPEELFKALGELKNSIICLYAPAVTSDAIHHPKRKEISDGSEIYCLNKYQYPRYHDFYTMLSSALNDYRQRYLIPQNIKNDLELELLVDNFLRSGFSFFKEGEAHE